MKKSIFTSIVLLAACTLSYGQWVNGTNIYNTNSGNVGIGTSAPAEKLHINGNVRGNQAGALRISTGNGYIDIGPKNPDYAHFYTDRTRGFYFSHDVTVSGTGTIGSYWSQDLKLATQQSSGTYSMITRMTILRSNGFVGIGKTTPGYLLDVAGPVNATSFLVNGVPVGNQWTASGANLNFTSGMVSIGTTTAPAGYKLAVGGKIVAEELIVKLQSTWPDFVFEKDYPLPSLENVEKFIAENKHLPGIPSASSIEKQGLAVGEMEAKLLQKVEELTLYVIELKKEIDELKASNR
jgi:hypothetical protein